MKKKYIIVGDNNFWYSTTGEITEEELAAEIENLKQNVSSDDTGDLGHAVQLFAYEITGEKITFDVSDVAN